MSRVARRTESKEDVVCGSGRLGYTIDARKDLRVFFAPSMRTAAMRACWSSKAWSISHFGLTAHSPLLLFFPPFIFFHLNFVDSSIVQHQTILCYTFHDFNDTTEQTIVQVDVMPNHRVMRARADQASLLLTFLTFNPQCPNKFQSLPPMNIHHSLRTVRIPLSLTHRIQLGFIPMSSGS